MSSDTDNRLRDIHNRLSTLRREELKLQRLLERRIRLVRYQSKFYEDDENAIQLARRLCTIGRITTELKSERKRRREAFAPVKAELLKKKKQEDEQRCATEMEHAADMEEEERALAELKAIVRR